VSIFAEEMHVYPKGILSGLALLAKGDVAAARADLAAALDTLNALVAERPDDHRLYSSIGLCQAGLQQPKAAVANGRKSVEMYPLSKDHYGATWRLEEMAIIYAMAGYRKEAIEQLDEILSMPGPVTTYTIEFNPAFDWLRDDPDFQAMIRKHKPTS
jgi:tetratricopeptide (TPR) repeat protein